MALSAIDRGRHTWAEVAPAEICGTTQVDIGGNASSPDILQPGGWRQYRDSDPESREYTWACVSFQVQVGGNDREMF